jgi:hypothetical protein
MFYTYLWLRSDGTPYYVGKGCGNRAYFSTPGHREAEAFVTETEMIANWGRKDWAQVVSIT